LFINIGEKDGINPQRLVQFITESTDVEPNVIERVTVKDLSSFFNVPADAADYIKEHLSQKKYKNRKVRLEEAEQSRGPREGGESRGGFRPAGSDRGGSRYSGDVRSYGSGEKRSGGSYSSRNRSKDS
jgi:ATP-dependent RNA helicase DeaD